MFFWHDRVARPGWFNMAIDRSLLEQCQQHQPQIIRLYYWEMDTISLGANEAATKHWDRVAIETAGVPVVRRPTGGRAVWHSAQDLTYATVLPVKDWAEARSAYTSIHQQLLRAMQRIGQGGGLAPAPTREPGLSAGSCFEAAAGGEVILAGRKTIGSAQLIHQHALLQHGEIARESRHRQLATFARVTPPADIAELSGRLPESHLVAAAIELEWRDAGAIAAPEELIAAVLSRAAEHAAFYRDPAWTWRR